MEDNVVELPQEIWILIFKYLDFKTLQCKAILVCKKWFELIRSNSTLSGEFTLNTQVASEIEFLLSNWKKLKVLRSPILVKKCEKEQLIDFGVELDFQNVNLKACKHLKKVIVPNDTRFHENIELSSFPSWFNVCKYWYNPQNESASLCPENMVEICIHFGDPYFPQEQEHSYETNQSLESIAKRMEDLESITIRFNTYYSGNFEYCFPLLKGLQSCKKLKKLKFWFLHDGLVYNQNLRLVPPKITYWVDILYTVQLYFILTFRLFCHLSCKIQKQMMPHLKPLI